MLISDAQQDMRTVYLGGGTGVLVSGIVWLTAGILSFYFPPKTCIIVFFFGGMFIHPLGILLCKLLKRSGKHLEENPLAKLALESTVLIFVGLFIAYSCFDTHQEWFFPIMMMIIGVRYLIFHSIYGMKIYWMLGLVLVLAGTFCLIQNQALHVSALTGGIIEVLIGIGIIKSNLSK